MSARTKARKKALDFLFAADLRGGDAQELYLARVEDETPLGEEKFVELLLSEVKVNQTQIDDLISTYAQGWDMDRMPGIDRNILRIAIAEILFQEATPDAVAISEAVELAQELSTRESSAYINGLLGRIVAIKSSL